MASLVLLALIAYVSTNLDNLVLLVGFSAHASYHRNQILLGAVGGMVVLILISLFGAAQINKYLPGHMICLLGAIPACLGLWKLATAASPPTIKAGRLQTLTVTVAMVANGGDNIATYVPLYAGLTAAESGFVVLLFMLLTGLWCWFARAISHQPVLGRWLRLYSTDLLPYLLITAGVFIFLRNL